MFKCSFKEEPKNPSKVILKKGRNTSVILKGSAKLPEFWHLMPKSIFDWIESRKKVEIYENIVDNTLIIYSTGTANCHEDDKYDSVLGERIAESRAKYFIYKFFYDLCYRLCEYYGKLLYGNDGPVVDSGNGAMMDCFRKYEGLCIRESHHLGELLNNSENG